MGQANEHYPVLLTCSVLATDRKRIADTIRLLENEWNTNITARTIVPFEHTVYYNHEMADTILRVYLATETLINPRDISEIKHQTNILEHRFSVDNKRKVNLDPGYITLAKFVLVTTKDATHRIYLGNGMYAESTLFYEADSFAPWPWTYPDYRSDHAISFLNSVRNGYKTRLKQDKSNN